MLLEVGASLRPIQPDMTVDLGSGSWREPGLERSLACWSSVAIVVKAAAARLSSEQRMIPAVRSPDGCPAFVLAAGAGPSGLTEAGMRRTWANCSSEQRRS